MVSWETEHIKLRDGAAVGIRPLAADDRGLVSQVFEGLSARSRVQRFLRPVASLSEEDLSYLTEDVDHRRHEALVAVEPGSRARREGIRRYTAVVAMDNREMADRLERAGAMGDGGSGEEGTSQYVVELPTDGIGGLLQRVLRAAARR